MNEQERVARLAVGEAVHAVVQGDAPVSAEEAKLAVGAAAISAYRASHAERGVVEVPREVQTKLEEIIKAYNDGALEMNSPEICGGDIPLHPWHEEWLHGARKALGHE